MKHKFRGSVLFSNLIYFPILYTLAFVTFLNVEYGALGLAFSISAYLGFIYHYHLYKNRFKERQELGLMIESVSILLIVSATLFYYYFTDNSIPFTVSLILPITWLLIRGKHRQSIEANYLKSPKITFTLLLSTFILMWLLGGVANFAFGVFSASNFFSSLALGYLPFIGLGAIYDIISIFSTITGTTWFLIAVGIWLGILVVYRIKEERKLENKIRMSVMLIAYWVYSIYIPKFSPITNQVQYIPYMWFNGIGTYGPISPSVLLTGILGTYIVTALLSAFFGSRQICSVTCTAPYMLQGSFFDSLKTYNRTSNLGRKTLTSKLQWWFKFNAGVLWGSLLAFSILSYLDQIGVISFSIVGTDPTMFLTSLYFNFLWWVQFFAIPFFGNYACATQGLCHWGLYNQFFSYIGGIFKLKVKDPQKCLTCKTVDCAKACPVGLTDMRANFLKRGEFRAFKCIGAGDCIEACPYDNIYIYDIRHKIKSFLGKSS